MSVLFKQESTKDIMDSQQPLMQTPRRDDSGYLSLGNTPNSRNTSPIYSTDNDRETPMDVDKEDNLSNTQRRSARSMQFLYHSLLRGSRQVDGTVDRGLKIVATVGMKGPNGAHVSVVHVSKKGEEKMVEPKSATLRRSALKGTSVTSAQPYFSAEPPAPDSDDVLGVVTICDSSSDMEDNSDKVVKYEEGQGQTQGRDQCVINSDMENDSTMTEQYGEGHGQSQGESQQLQLSYGDVESVQENNTNADSCGFGARPQIPTEQQSFLPQVPIHTYGHTGFEPEKNDRMQIFVLDLQGKTHTFWVRPADKVDDLMSKIEQRIGVAVSQQRLHYGGKDLERGRSLAYYKIQKESTVHLTARLRGGDFAASPSLPQSY